MPPDHSSSDMIDQLRAALGAQYSVERQLGQGGMGAVYLARDVTLDRLVAVKVISPDVADTSALRERFLLEARSVARLRHPNIVSVYTAGESNGLAYFVMEYVPGESLRDLLDREKQLVGDRAERIVREIAMALDYAHTHGLVHRDVKPENILLDTESGRAMLMDFGIARAFEKDANAMTQAGMILGSPRYMAPEQASGDRAIDGRSDIYTLSLVAYELFTGSPVVGEGSFASMLVKHVTETPPPLALKVKGITPHVAQAIDKGLAKDPDQRWQTGRAFAEALAGAPISSTGEVGRPVSRSRLSFAQKIGAAAVAVVVIAAAWIGVQRFGGTAGTAYLVTPFEVQSGDQRVQWLKDGSVNMLTLTLGQWSDLNVINYERTLSLLDAANLGTKSRLSLDDALKLARQASAGTVVTGQVQTTRDSLIVVAKLFDVRTGKPLQTAQQGAAIGDDPRPLYDRLAQDLLAIAGGPASGVQLSQATTTSLEAYRAYLEGVKSLNSWRLGAADSAFARAIQLDSTFALAFYKRSLGLGWSSPGSPENLRAAEQASSLGKRLPARESALVQGNYHLVKAISQANAGNNKGDRTEFDAAITTYQKLLERDSVLAEAWYGLADGYYHGRTVMKTPDEALAFANGALRGFHRTLRIDSTFHLAYSHLVDLHNAAATSDVLLVGDTTFILTSSGGAATDSLRRRAQARGVEIAKAWVRAEPTSTRPILQLANSYFAATQFDSAMGLLKGALANKATSEPNVRMILLRAQVQLSDTGMRSTLRHVLDKFTGDSLRTMAAGQRFGLNGSMLTAAAGAGRMGDVRRASKLFVETDSTLPFATTPIAPALRMYTLALGIAVGEPLTPEASRELLALMRGVDSMPAPNGEQVRASSQSVALLGFLATKDTAFARYLRKWAGASPWTEVDALIALQKGDTATAERIAKAFTKPDSLRKPGVRFGMAGLRQMARAEVLVQAGLTRQAAETYEAVDPTRASFNSFIEPGYPLLVRSFLVQARLWRELGERDKAVAAYERFIALWKDAEGPAARELGIARQELSAVRDAPRGTTR